MTKSSKHPDRPTETIEQVYGVRNAVADKRGSRKPRTYCDRRANDYRIKMVASSKFAKAIQRRMKKDLPHLDCTIRNGMNTEVVVLVPLLTPATTNTPSQLASQLSAIEQGLGVVDGRGEEEDLRFDLNASMMNVSENLGVLSAMLQESDYETFDVHVNELEEDVEFCLASAEKLVSLLKQAQQTVDVLRRQK